MEGEQGVQGLQDAAAAQASKELQAFLAEGDHTQGGASVSEKLADDARRELAEGRAVEDIEAEVAGMTKEEVDRELATAEEMAGGEEGVEGEEKPSEVVYGHLGTGQEQQEEKAEEQEGAGEEEKEGPAAAKATAAEPAEPAAATPPAGPEKREGGEAPSPQAPAEVTKEAEAAPAAAEEAPAEEAPAVAKEPAAEEAPAAEPAAEEAPAAAEEPAAVEEEAPAEEGGEKRKREAAEEEASPAAEAEPAAEGGKGRGGGGRKRAKKEGGGGGAVAEDYLEKIRSIPAGQTRTYTEVATMAGRPNGARSVGKAIRQLDVKTTDVPWHRVVGADGKLQGEGAPTGALQLQKLQEEGARPRDGESVSDWAKRVGAHMVGAYTFQAERYVYAELADPRVEKMNTERVEPFASVEAAEGRDFVRLSAMEVDE